MPNENYATYHEIVTQTDAWEQGIENSFSLNLPNINEYVQVLFIGCGSTFAIGGKLPITGKRVKSRSAEKSINCRGFGMKE
jgi:hypothetical protein